MTIKAFFSCACIAIFLLLASADIQGSSNQSDLKNKRISIQMKGKSLFSVFQRLINKYDIAIGLEESSLDRLHDHYFFETNAAPAEWSERDFKSGYAAFDTDLITVGFTDAKLEDVMDSIVKQMKNYDWEINDEVVNVFPIRGRNPKFKSLLGIKVRRFIVEKDSELSAIQSFLFASEEFKTFLNDNQLYVDGWRVAPFFTHLPLKTKIDLSDLTFRDLLNAITKAKRGGWILQTSKHKRSEDREFIDILI